MRLFKYRDLSDPSTNGAKYLKEILAKRAFWAASPESLNDTVEFKWDCLCAASDQTVHLLARFLSTMGRRTSSDALLMAKAVIEDDVLSEHVQPLVEALQAQCRNELGLICFGDREDNACLWQRYGGAGSGVCIELEVPDRAGSVIYPVYYRQAKQLHVDEVLRAMLNDRDALEEVYREALFTKPRGWSSEGEWRFLSKMQGINVSFEGAEIRAVILGAEASEQTEQLVLNIVDELPYRPELRRATGK